MDDDNSHMEIAISKGLTPWKVGLSETVRVWRSALESSKEMPFIFRLRVSKAIPFVPPTGVLKRTR